MMLDAWRNDNSIDVFLPHIPCFALRRFVLLLLVLLRTYVEDRKITYAARLCEETRYLWFGGRVCFLQVVFLSVAGHIESGIRKRTSTTWFIDTCTLSRANLVLTNTEATFNPIQYCKGFAATGRIAHSTAGSFNALFFLVEHSNF